MSSLLSVRELMAVGFSATRAAEISVMSPPDQITALPIVGNAFSDMPLFKAIRATMKSKTATIPQLRLAVEQSYKVVGMDDEIPLLDTDTQVRTAVEQYLGDLEAAVKQYLGELK